jgi:hypothetical protein
MCLAIDGLERKVARTLAMLVDEIGRQNKTDCDCDCDAFRRPRFVFETANVHWGSNDTDDVTSHKCELTLVDSAPFWCTVIGYTSLNVCEETAMLCTAATAST